MKKLINSLAKSIISLLIAILILTSCITGNHPVSAKTLEEQLKPDEKYGVKFDYTVSDDYQAFLDAYNKKGYKAAKLDNPINLKVSDYSDIGNSAEFKEENGEQVLIWSQELEYIEWQVDIPQSGLYCMSANFSSHGSGSGNIVRALSIDGKTPFEESSNLRFYRLYKDSGKPLINSAGDQVRPSVEELIKWQNQPFLDMDAAYETPLQFFLEKGVRKVRLSLVDESMLLKNIEIFAPKTLEKYSDVLQKWKEKGYKNADKEIFFEAEGQKNIYKNASTLRMDSDGDPATSPQKTGNVVMNVVGGTSWQNGNTALTWKVDAESEGLYQLSFRLKQNFREGFPSYRRISVNGQVPYEELNSYKFLYDKNWRNETLVDKDGVPLLVYLKKGENILTISVCQGELTPLAQMFYNDALRLSDILLRIRMITGQTPDPNYDYELDKNIPDLIETFKSIIENMKTSMEYMEKVSQTKPSKYYQLQSFIGQFENLVGNPFIIPRRTDDLNQILSSYGDWHIQLLQHPLIIDNISFSPPDTKISSIKSNFGSRTWASVVNFFVSFTKDYDSITGVVSDYEIDTTLDVWIGRGKDWAMLIKQMADEEFTKETGIGVNINILPAGQLNTGSVNALLLAVSSGRAPDIGLATATSAVGEFALRNAVVDLSTMSGFKDFENMFLKELFLPMTLNGGTFGIPETMNFTTMVYRKDILADLV